MSYINHFIRGTPYGKTKRRGDREAPQRWTDAVVKQTDHLPRIKDECMLKVTFLLPPDKYPADLPYGSDLDNLLKRFLDALNQTIFSMTIGKDSSVVSLTATKVKVPSSKEAGAYLEVLPVKWG